jgi:hypothetical protein
MSQRPSVRASERPSACRALRSLVLLAVLTALSAGEPSVAWSVAKTQINVGDPVVATLTYRWPAGWRPLVEPDPALALTGVFVADLPAPVAQDTAEEHRRTWTITLVSTRSGAWELPRPAFTVRPPAGEPVTSTAPSIVVQVGTAAAPVALPEPRPAWTRPPAAVGRAWWPWIAGGGAVLAGVAVLLWWRLRRRTPPPPPISVARRALAAALDIADARESATAVSLALRRYAGAVWAFDGAGATTRETAAHLRSLGDRVQAEELTELLRLLGGLDDLRWVPGQLDAPRIKPLADAGLAWLDAVQRRLDAVAAAAGVKP